MPTTPLITIESDADLTTDLVDLLLAYVAGYEGVVDLAFEGAPGAVTYKVVKYLPETRTLHAQVWDDHVGEGSGPIVELDANILLEVHVY